MGEQPLARRTGAHHPEDAQARESLRRDQPRQHAGTVFHDTACNRGAACFCQAAAAMRASCPFARKEVL